MFDSINGSQVIVSFVNNLVKWVTNIFKYNIRTAQACISSGPFLSVRVVVLVPFDITTKVTDMSHYTYSYTVIHVLYKHVMSYGLQNLLIHWR